MARIYANLIEKGYRTIDSIRPELRDSVRKLLIDDGYPELAGK